MNNNEHNSHDETGFDFTEGQIDPDDLMRDSTDDTDYAQKEKNKKLWKVIAIFATVGILGLALLFGTLSILEHKTEREEPETTETQKPKETEKAHNDSTNPIEESITNPPEVKPGESKAETKDTNFITTDEIKLNIKGSKLKDTQIECIVKNTTDFCLAGYAEVRDIKTNVYYLKDAAHSRLFEAAENFQKQEVEGALTAGTMTINLSGQTPIIAIVAENGSGFIITLPDDNPETIQTFTQALTLS